MKVIDAQAAVLTNYEVLEHLTQQKDRYKQRKRRGPPNLETVVREVCLLPPPKMEMRVHKSLVC